MARIRTIKPEYWTDKKVAQWPLFTRLLFIGLWSAADDHGRGSAEHARLASELFPYDLSRDPRETLASVSEGLATLSEAKRITLYEVNGESYYQVENWTKHQRVDKPGKSKIPTPNEEFARPSRDSRETLASGSGIREQGSGNREQEEKKNLQKEKNLPTEENQQPGTEQPKTNEACPLLERLPPQLGTEEFRAMWMRWTAYCFHRDGRHNEPQLEMNLMTLLERVHQGGIEKAIADLRYSIESGTKGRIYDSSADFSKRPPAQAPPKPDPYAGFVHFKRKRSVAS